MEPALPPGGHIAAIDYRRRGPSGPATLAPLRGATNISSTPAQLARCIEILLDNPGVAWRIAHEGRKEWESRFRVERYQREICDFLKSLQKDVE